MSEKRYYITVTQEHIDAGFRWQPKCCPFALAVRDALFEDHPEGYVSCVNRNVGVADNFIDVLNHKLVVYDIPPQVEAKLRAYDNGAPLEPFRTWIYLNREEV
jgi:hypothetical protein